MVQDRDYTPLIKVVSAFNQPLTFDAHSSYCCKYFQV